MCPVADLGSPLRPCPAAALARGFARLASMTTMGTDKGTRNQGREGRGTKDDQGPGTKDQGLSGCSSVQKPLPFSPPPLPRERHGEAGDGGQEGPG